LANSRELGIGEWGIGELKIGMFANQEFSVESDTGELEIGETEIVQLGISACLSLAFYYFLPNVLFIKLYS